MKDILVSICSGLIGVLLTIGYQHFLAPEQPIIVNIDGKEVEVTSTNYEELSAQNESLKAENSLLAAQNAGYLDEITKANIQIEELRIEKNDTQDQTENDKLKSDINNLQNKILQYQNNETFLEAEIINLQNELNKYIIEYGKISINNSETVSIFTLETFQGSEFWFNKSNISNSKSFTINNFIDTYGNEYPESNLTDHSRSNTKDKGASTYLLDYNYSKCSGKIAWPKSDKNVKGSVWIEFYSNDELIYQTKPMYASDRALDFEFSVNNVEKLTIVKKASDETGFIYIIYPYFNLIK